MQGAAAIAAGAAVVRLAAKPGDNQPRKVNLARNSKGSWAFGSCLLPLSPEKTLWPRSKPSETSTLRGLLETLDRGSVMRVRFPNLDPESSDTDRMLVASLAFLVWIALMLLAGSYVLRSEAPMEISTSPSTVSDFKATH
jgi:hypothetical protein